MTDPLMGKRYRVLPLRYVTLSVFCVDTKQQCCAACGIKLGSYIHSHSIDKSDCSLYDLDESNYQDDWNVCSNCFKLRRRKSALYVLPAVHILISTLFRHVSCQLVGCLSGLKNVHVMFVFRCPVPSCTTPRRRSRYRPIKWGEMSETIRANIVNELGMYSTSACLYKLQSLY